MRGRFVLGDCIEEMRKLPDESFRGIVTSPPYNIGVLHRHYCDQERMSSLQKRLKSGKSLPRSNWHGGRIHVVGFSGEDMDDEEYVAWQRACLTEMVRLIRPDGAIFYNHKWRIRDGLLDDRSDILRGFPVRQMIVWKKQGVWFFHGTHFASAWESIYLIAKPEFRLAEGTNAHTDFWEIGKDSSQLRDRHPAPFPLGMARRCCQSLGSGPILDPFMGSGTVAEACELEAIDWLGIEINPEYVADAESRLAKYDSMLPFSSTAEDDADPDRPAGLPAAVSVNGSDSGSRPPAEPTTAKLFDSGFGEVASGSLRVDKVAQSSDPSVGGD